VLNVTRGSTNISYTVEDGTGQIDVRQWVEQAADDEGAASDAIEQDTLVRIVGNVKVFHSKRNINAISVRPVSDMNEQQFHLLDVIYTHLYNTKGPLVSLNRRRGENPV
jgi:replication factor A2